MTNKTLTSPTLTTPKVLQLTDTNGNETIKTPATGSAVNYLVVTNSASTDPIQIEPDGATNLGLTLKAKGTGSIDLATKVSMTLETVTGTGAASALVPLTLLNNGGAIAISLIDGDKNGQMKKFINIGAGVATITPATFANGTTVALAQYAVAELIWTGSTWVLCNQATVGTVPALTVA